MYPFEDSSALGLSSVGTQVNSSALGLSSVGTQVNSSALGLSSVGTQVNFWSFLLLIICHFLYTLIPGHVLIICRVVKSLRFDLLA